MVLYDSSSLKGIALAETEKVLNALDLNWSILSRPATYLDPNGQTVVTDKQFLLKVTGETYTELGVFGKDLKPAQPQALLSAIQAISRKVNLKLVAGGHTREGKHIYFLCKLLDEHHTNLSLSRYLICHTSNDANGKTKIQPVYVCEQTNTQLGLIDNVVSSSRIFELSHHFSFDDIEALIIVSRKLGEYWDLAEEQIGALLRSPVNRKTIEIYHEALYPRFSLGNDKTKRGFDLVQAELYANHSEFIKKQGLEPSYFSLFNAFSYYLDHVKRRNGDSSGAIHSLNFGHDGKSKRVAFEVASKHALGIFS
ncbi:DUF932 domain-containing protein [Vibrio fortis]|uniref:DUF932 domain-containing protein n=1 Tax=Vibrio fortis TaxID=212667 RepID=UPI004069017C